MVGRALGRSPTAAESYVHRAGEGFMSSMSRQAPALPERPVGSRIHTERLWPLLTLLPSVAAIGLFVYGFIGWTFAVSFSNWNSLIPDMSFSGLKNYASLLSDFRFQSDVRNMVVFTLLFILTCTAIGLVLAVMIDQRIRAERLFETIFLFPMAVAFIVTGVVWRWLLNPSTGVNLLLKDLGIQHLPLWYVDTRVVPGVQVGQIQLGLPLALIALMIAAVWQMSSFSMALYLAGLRAIPEELKEAAQVDGAGPWAAFWQVIFPQLRSITVANVVILAHVSLKIFDLVYAMTGPGAMFVTDMLSMNMFTTTFQANHFAQGAAIAVVLLILVAAFMVPYLVSSLKGESAG